MKRDQATQAADKAQQSASGALDKAKEAAVHTGEAISCAAQAAGDVVAKKAEDATAAVGRGMETLGEKVREKGPHDGMLGTASEKVADALERGGRYVEEKNLSGMADDLGEVIKKNPIPALLIGVGVGFLLGRALRS
jgi:ElaB/YqjD/DUF883 family membrane-anchored ribosome-binding protein